MYSLSLVEKIYSTIVHTPGITLPCCCNRLMGNLLLGKHDVLLEPVLLLGGNPALGDSILSLNLDDLGLIGSELRSDRSIRRLGEGRGGRGGPLLGDLGGGGGRLGLGLVVFKLTEVDLLDGVGWEAAGSD